MNHSRDMGLSFGEFAYTEIWNTNTRGLDVVIDLGRKHKLQVLVNTNRACVSSQLLTGYLSSGKKGRTALMLSLKIPYLLGTMALAKLYSRGRTT